MAGQYYKYPVQSVSATNPSVGPNGSPIPGQSTLVAGENPSGIQQPLQTDASGNLLVNIASGSGPDDVNIAAFGGVSVSLGQKLEVSSIPVVLASDEVVPISATSLPLPTGAATEATLATRASEATVATLATEATLSAFSNKTSAGLVPEAFDYEDITYVGATTNINTVVFKLGGTGGTVVATLTMGYDGSNRLISVTKT